MLGGTIPDEDDNDVIAEQLAKISEQMAIKNRRSKKNLENCWGYIPSNCAIEYPLDNI